MSPDEEFLNFRIIERIGYGGMATVYTAEDPNTGNTVALKILHDHYATDKAIIKRFNREANIFYHLNHPNIVPIIAHGKADGKFYIAMQYMAGGTLFERFGYQKEVTLNFTLGLLEQIAAALDFAHEQGVIHRDLKLENVLLDDNDTPYLTNFGIALLVDATRLTTKQAVSGTPLFMSPEQALGLEVTARSDIYSLSVMAYVMLTGYHPFTGRDPYSVLNQHISTPPPLPTAVNDTLPPMINKVLLRGLEKEPAKRYATGSELVSHLTSNLTGDLERTQTMIRLNAQNPQALKIADEYQTTVLGIAPTTENAASVASQRNKNRLQLIGGIIIAVVVIGLIIALTSNNGNVLGIASIETPTSVVTDSTATVLRRDGALLVSSPNRNREELGLIPVDTAVTLIGRTDPAEFLEVETEDGLTGFVKRDQIHTTIDVMNLQITGELDNNEGNRGGQIGQQTCQFDPTNAPSGFIIGRDGVQLLAEPDRAAATLMTLPADEQVKLVSRDQSMTFIEVEANDPDETHGYVLRGQLRTEVNLDCLALRRNREEG